MKKVIFFIVILVLSFCFFSSMQAAPTPSLAQKIKVIADFNSGDKPNNVGGDFGAWDKDPSDPTQGCKMSFDQDDAFGLVGGYSIRLDYAVDSPNPAYCGFWMKFNGIDATPYNRLNFYIKGDRVIGFTKALKIELKDINDVPSPFVINGITDQWQKVSIPFEGFQNITNWSALNEFVIIFDGINSRPKLGAIYLDHIYLSKE